MFNDCPMQCNPGLIPGPAPTKCRQVDCAKLRTFKLPIDMGTDEGGQPYAPKLGAYHNAIVIYESTGSVYLYDDEGIFTKVNSNVDGIQVTNQQVQRDTALTTSQSGVSLNITTGQLQGATSTTKTLNFPTVSANQAGFMTAALYAQIQAMQQKVDTMWSGERPENPAITAHEYDALDLTASQYDEKKVEALPYDERAKEILE